METLTLHPYLFFNGTCRETMEFYYGVFGGELSLQSYSQVQVNAPAELADMIIHARLEGEVTLMASDTTPAASAEVDAISLYLNGSDEERLRAYSERLAGR